MPYMVLKFEPHKAHKEHIRKKRHILLKIKLLLSIC